MKRNLLGISLITMSCLYGMLAAVIILIFMLTDLPNYLWYYNKYNNITITVLNFAIFN